MKGRASTWRRALSGCAIFATLLAACGSEGPRASGSKTNWFQLCDTDLMCGEEGACICGFCTQPCGASGECPLGECGSELASAAVCDEAAPSRLCLPTNESPGEVEPPGGPCSELAFEVDADLGGAAGIDCAVPGALVCESFDAPIAERHSVWIQGDIEGELQNCVVHSGAGAARFSATTTSGEAFVQTRFRLPEAVGSGALYTRLFAYLPTGTPLPEQLILAELWSDSPDFSSERITLVLRSDGTPSAYVGASSVTLSSPADWVLPRDEWACLELGVEIDPAEGAVSLSLNGASPVEQRGIGTSGTAPFSIAVFSALFAEGATNATVYVDDFVVATAPIGCGE